MLKQSQRVSALYPLLLLLMTVILSACAHSPQPAPIEPAHSEQSLDSASNGSGQQNTSSEPMDGLQYGDAKADVRLAITRQDFQFLATSNRTIALPGIDLEKYSLAELEQQCGYRFLKGMGDTVQDHNDIQQRKAFHRYATEYNQLMFIACQGGTL